MKKFRLEYVPLFGLTGYAEIVLKGLSLEGYYPSDDFTDLLRYLDSIEYNDNHVEGHGCNVVINDIIDRGVFVFTDTVRDSKTALIKIYSVESCIKADRFFYKHMKLINFRETINA